VQIIIANTAIFIAVCISGHAFTPSTRTLLRWGANFGGMTLNGQWWRLLSSAFLHAGVPHLALNMWAFLNLGVLAELLFGRLVYVPLYFFCALGGSLASVWWHSDVVGVGASGAIFGVAGALLTALAFQHNRQMRAAMRGNLTSIAIFVFYNIAFGAAAAHVDNAAHMGGLITGAMLGVLLPSGPVRQSAPAEAPQPDYPGIRQPAPAWRLTGLRRSRVLRYWLAFGLIAVLLLATAISARHRNQDAGAFSMALKALRSGDQAQALQQLERVLQRRPNFPEAHFLLANIYLERKDLDNALRELKRTVELNPKFAEAQGQLCSVYARKRALRDALPYCQAAVSLDPSNPDRRYNLGLVQMALRDYGRAVESLQKAADARPDSADENYELAVALFLNGDMRRAATQAEKVLRIAPNYARARELLDEIKAQNK
jgi:rhomboid protease GluP